MALDTGMKCIKYLLFIFNLLFVVSGSAVIVVGAVLEAKYGSYLSFVSTHLSAPSLLIAIGVLIFSVGFFGCCGAIKENHCMVVTFCVLLVVIFVIQLVVGVCSYMMRTEVEEFLRANMFQFMTTYNATNEGVYRTWNVIQHDKACCGTDGFRDWENTPFGLSVNGVPDDCCKESIQDCGRNIFEVDFDNLDLINRDGCFDKMKGDVEENLTLLGGVAIGIGCVQLVGVFFACCLAKSLKRQCETV